ncbi:MAG: hypothetical protein HC889_02265 [Synechococcaceae cyanobacterium SM1_2_3]|nr:hypothetical protein [Synechococcaceae cyanobacterium SM1_2_3]
MQAAPGGVASFDVNMTKAGGIWTVDPAEQAALNHFCGAITNTPAWLVQPPLLVHSESGLQGKANDLVQAAVNYIRGRGVVGRIDTDPTKVNKKFRWPWTAHKTAAVVRITVQSVNEMVKDWQSDYVVTAHEFGHCIGIPDEYLDYSAFSNATIKNSQPLWDTLCTNYGAPQRNWHDQYNDSMMSIGRTIYKAHGVTICHALDTMTQGGPNNMGARSWTVVGP